MKKLQLLFVLITTSIGAYSSFAACDYATCKGGSVYCCDATDGSCYQKAATGK